MVEEPRPHLEQVEGASSRMPRRKILVVQHLLWRLLRVFDRFLGIRIQRRIEFGR